MAFLPTIPTSFVPRPTEAPRQFKSDFTGAFGFFAYGVFGLFFFLSLGVFLYGRILSADKVSKDAEINARVEAIDVKTAESFVRLRNRLTIGGELLANHAAFSTFFSSIEKILPSAVRFSGLNLSLGSEGVSTVEGSGIAKSFNTLAVVSTVFSADGRIKDAIFSDITINKDGSVSFSFSANLDPEIIVFSP